jgi:hypothetical protein
MNAFHAFMVLSVRFGHVLERPIPIVVASEEPVRRDDGANKSCISVSP